MTLKFKEKLDPDNSMFCYTCTAVQYATWKKVLRIMNFYSNRGIQSQFRTQRRSAKSPVNSNL